jgi:hypothetical protein
MRFGAASFFHACAQGILGLTAVVYLDDFMPTAFRRSSASVGSSMATGIRVSVHDAGTAPDMKGGVSVGPGVETTISLTATVRQRLPPPYEGWCTNQQYIDDSQELKYNADTCDDVCNQKKVNCMQCICEMLR